MQEFISVEKQRQRRDYVDKHSHTFSSAVMKDCWVIITNGNVHTERYEVHVLWNSMSDSFIALNESGGMGVLSRHQIDIFN